MTTDPNDWNARIIKEFRENEGRVGGPFQGATLVLLHTVGAKSGAERINPLVSKDLGDGHIAVFASKAGATSHPDWYYNLVADPEVSIEIGTESRDVVAHVAHGEERAAIWNPRKVEMSVFVEYEQSAGSRQIPVVLLDLR